jgi:hypothetical protein
MSYLYTNVHTLISDYFGVVQSCGLRGEGKMDLVVGLRYGVKIHHMITLGLREFIFFIYFIIVIISGGFSFLVWGVGDPERSEPKIFATPLQGGGQFYRGVATINPLTYKHRADI